MICGNCYEEVDELFDTGCNEKPEDLKGAPLGQYHCPECGVMVMAGMSHFLICKRCIDYLTNNPR